MAKENLQHDSFPFQSFEALNRDPFLTEILKLTRQEKIRDSLLCHIMEGRLKVAQLRDLSIQLGAGRRIGPTVPTLISVFGWKVVGKAIREIAECLGISKNTVGSLVTQIYEVILPDETGLKGPVDKLRRLAEEEGFISG